MQALTQEAHKVQIPFSRNLETVHRTVSQAVEKPLTGFSDKFLQSATRIICAPAAHKFVLRRAKSRLRRLRSAQRCGARLRSLRSIFCQVHAPTENDFDFICRLTPPNSARLFGQVASTALTPGQQIFQTIQRMFYGFWFKNSFASVFFCEKGKESLCNVLCYASFDSGFSL